MEKENEAIQKQLDCLKQAMDEEDEEVSLGHTDYGNTKAKSLILCGSNSNRNHKIGGDSLAENTPNAMKCHGNLGSRMAKVGFIWLLVDLG